MIKQVDLNLENYGITKFLFYTTTSLEEVERAELEVLRNSEIPGLLPCAVLKQEDDVCIRYDLISDTTLQMHLSQPVSKKILIQILSSIVETLQKAHQCGLNIENFVFNLNHIFIDNFSSRLVFIYLPVKNNVFEKVSLKEFLKEIVTFAPFDENDDLHFFIKLHNYLLNSIEINLNQLQENLNEWNAAEQPSSNKPVDSAIQISPKPAANPFTSVNPNFYSPGSSSNEPVPNPVENPISNSANGIKTTVNGGVVTSEYSSQKKEMKRNRQLEIEEEVQYKRITRTDLDNHHSLLKSGSPIGGTSINIGPNVGGSFIQNIEPEGTTVLGASVEDEDEGTTMLGVGVGSTPRPFLRAKVGNEKIMITKDEFKIGRDPGQADYVSNNKVVGRVHALILSANGEYFFEDNHSRNGSYVNGVKALPNGRIKIKHDDVIKLANEEYIFKLF